MQTHDTIQHTIGSAVGAGGTFTVSYPAGRSSDDYQGGGGNHYVVSNFLRTLFAKSNDFTLTFGASNISVVMTGGVALPAGAVIYLNVDRAEAALEDLANPAKMSNMTPVRIMLGAPIAASANAISLSQALNTGVDGLINGAQATAGVATLATPRNVVAAWTTAAIITITGTDEYGAVIVESSASGTSFTGKKAFKTITKVRVSANVTGLTVGIGVVLGLPVFLADVPDVVKELQDGAAATAGTPVKGDQTAATATTGDVRGTYAPNAAPDGSKVFELICFLRSVGHKGVAQYAG